MTASHSALAMHASKSMFGELSRAAQSASLKHAITSASHAPGSQGSKLLEPEPESSSEDPACAASGGRLWPRASHAAGRGASIAAADLKGLDHVQRHAFSHRPSLA